MKVMLPSRSNNITDFKYPRRGAKIIIHGEGYDLDRIGYFINKNLMGNLVLDMDPNNNFLPQEERLMIIHPWDNFEVIE